MPLAQRACLFLFLLRCPGGLESEVESSQYLYFTDAVQPPALRALHVQKRTVVTLLTYELSDLAIAPGLRADGGNRSARPHGLVLVVHPILRGSRGGIGDRRHDRYVCARQLERASTCGSSA